MNEMQVKKLFVILEESKDQEVKKAVKDIMVEEARKVNEWISGRPVNRPKLG